MPLWGKLIFGFIGAVVAAGSIAWYVWASGRVAEARQWPSAEGRVLASRVDEDRSEGYETDSQGRRRHYVDHTYHARVQYSYRVGDRTYTSDRIWLADGEAGDDAAGAQAFLADYPPGGEVELVYNPADPSDAALIVEAPTHLIFLVTGLGLAFLAVGVFVPRDRPIGDPLRGRRVRFRRRP